MSIPTWPDPVAPAVAGRRRRASGVLASVALVGLVGLVGAATAGPWRTESRVGGEALDRYLPLGDGDAATFVSDDGRVESTSIELASASDVVSGLPTAAFSAALSQLEEDGLLDGGLGDAGLEDIQDALRRTEVTIEQTQGRDDIGLARSSRGFLLRTSSGSYLLAEDGLVATVGYTPPVLVIPADLDEDRRPWSTEGTTTLGGGYTFEGRVLDEVDGIEVLGREVDGCLRLGTTFVFTVLDTERTVQNQLLVCPAMGVVERSEIDGDGDPVNTFRLVASTVEPSPTDAVAAAGPLVSGPALSFALGDPDDWVAERIGTLRPGTLTTAASFAPVELPVDPPVVLGADDEGGVVAIDPRTGSQLWRHGTGGPALAPPAFDAGSGTVVAVAADGIVRGLAVDGVLRWSAATADSIAAAPVVVDGTVVIAGEDRVIRGLDVLDGTERWTHELLAPAASDPVVVGDLVVVADDGGTITALLADDGGLEWEARASGPIDGRLATDGDLVVAAGRDGSVVGLDADDGGVAWRADVGSTDGGAAIAGDAVAIVDGEGHLRILDADDGTPVERFDAAFIRDPAAVGLADPASPDAFAVARADGALLVVDLSGDELATLGADDARSPLDDDPAPSLGPAIGPNGIWLADGEGVVRRFGPPGAVRRPAVDWAHESGLPGGPPSSQYTNPAVELDDGTVALVDEFGTVTLVDPDNGSLEGDTTIDLRGDVIIAEPVVADDLLVVATTTEVIAADPRSGEVAWRVDGAPARSASLQAGEGIVVFLDTDGDGTLRAVDAGDGDEVWSLPSPSTGAAPIIVGDLVVAGERVTARQLSTGEPVWELGPSVSPIGQPTSDGQLVFMATTAGVTAVTASTGAMVWEATLPNGSARRQAAAMALTADGVLAVPTIAFADSFGLVRGPLVALDATTGEELWQRQPTRSDIGNVAGIDDAVVVVENNGTVAALDSRSGFTRAATAATNSNGDAFIDPLFRVVAAGDTLVLAEASVLFGIDRDSLLGAGD